MLVNEPTTAARGCLVYVMGPSGAGKDAVISGARERLEHAGGRRQVYFSRRHVTRPDPAVREIPLTAEEFARYKQSGLFALDWQAHGRCYGVSKIIDSHLAAGKTVLVNGSRAYLRQALARYPAMLAVLITVPPQVAQEPLQARARETPDEIAERLARAPQIDADSAWLVTIDNSGALAHAVDALTDLLQNECVCDAIP